MHFKVILVFVEDHKTDAVMNAAREAGATGVTVINNARGEGLEKSKTLRRKPLKVPRHELETWAGLCRCKDWFGAKGASDKPEPGTTGIPDSS